MSEGALLSVDRLRAGYGGQVVVHEASITVAVGEIVGLVGHNGAGKTTLLRAIMGLAAVHGGTVAVAGREVTGQSTPHRVRSGVGYVPDGRQVFPNLTVADNLRLAVACAGRAGGRTRAFDLSADSAQMRRLFPIIAQRKRQLAGLMSGGEQQMLSIAMALAAGPDLVILDEPSIGLSPVVADRVLEVVARLRTELGVGVLIVEQNVRQLFELADRIEVMKLGRTTGAIDRAEVTDDRLWALF